MKIGNILVYLLWLLNVEILVCPLAVYGLFVSARHSLVERRKKEAAEEEKTCCSH